MPDFAEPLARLINEFKRLPGIGQKSAQRLAFHVLRASPRRCRAPVAGDPRRQGQARPLRVSATTSATASCASICRDPNRDEHVVCVVEEPHNIVGIETTRQFDGLYHVLHGSLSPLRGIGPEPLKIKGLVERIGQGEIQEVIVATNPDGGRRGDGGLSLAAAQAAGSEGDAHRHGNSGRQRPGVRRRSHDLESTWKAAARCSSLARLLLQARRPSVPAIVDVHQSGSARGTRASSTFR